MSGHRAWKEIRRPGNPGLEHGFEVAIEAATWLPELRRQAGLTQEQLAQRLDVTQSWISQIESETDVRLSTLAAYVAALGGQLRLCATLPDGHELDLTCPTPEPDAARAG
jgi:transcriptional regulator with XRE-family HTH domain